MKIMLKDRMGRLIKEVYGDKSASLILDRSYGFEDIIIFESIPKAFLEISLDPHLRPSIIYTPNGRVVYQLPAGYKIKAYHPDAFKGGHHEINIKDVSNSIMNVRRNLALNALDLRWETGYFPHASANVVTRDEPWFEAKNAIDGVLEREGHGAWPYQSWGGGLRDDLEFILDFGREVVIDEIVIFLRADYVDNHDVNWESGTLVFSDDTSKDIKMIKTTEGQSFSFDHKKIRWIKLCNLKREYSEAFSALTQIEVYGKES